MKHKRWIVAILFLALIILVFCIFKTKRSENLEEKTPEEKTESGEVLPSGNGGDHNNSTESSDFWENKEGLTVPPLTAPSETAEEVVSEVLTALQAADWETFNRRSLSYSMTGTGSMNLPENGIMEKIMRSISVTEKSVTDNGDGTYSANITLTTIDFRALAESLPESINSEAAAVAEMLRLADSAQHKSFTGKFTILRYSSVGRFFVEPDISFINAITGGFYDYYVEIMGGEEQ